MPATVLEKRQRQSLRLKQDIWQAIDESCAKRPGSVSRNTWIAEAIRDALARERANAENTRDRNA
jgi:metal-responsive CopG/Arc/MetJ family transcriptional regulator